MAKLRHPNIGSIYQAAVTTDGIAYIVMELVEGITLRDALATQMPYAERWSLWQQIAGALRHAHQKGIMHGDLHGRNVMVSNGRATVIDFGTSLFSSRGTETRREHEGLRRLLAEVLYEYPCPKLRTRWTRVVPIAGVLPVAELWAMETQARTLLLESDRDHDAGLAQRAYHQLMIPYVRCPVLSIDELIAYLTGEFPESEASKLLAALADAWAIHLERPDDVGWTWGIGLSPDASLSAVSAKLRDLQDQAADLFVRGRWR
jgi:hypothetical protein